MIGRLRGVLADRRSESVIVDVAGVGYEINVTPRTSSELPPIGDEVVLHTHLHVREDALTLYGFTDERSRGLCRLLLGAQGVGPKVALAILASLTVDDLTRAVASEDVDTLTLVPGIGKRSAQKLVLELKPKLLSADVETIGGDSALVRVREALEGLGYASAEIREVVASLPVDAPVEEQVRLALKTLGRSA